MKRVLESETRELPLLPNDYTVETANIPTEIWYYIFSFLSEAYRLCTIYGVCKTWAIVIEQEMRKMKHYFGDPFALIITRIPRIRSLMFDSVHLIRDYSIFNQLSELRSLRLVSAYSSRDNDKPIFSLTRLTNLTKIDIAFCDVILSPEAPLKKVTLFSVVYHDYEEKLRQYTKLETLILRGSRIVPSFPIQIPSLRELHCILNDATIGPELLFSMTQLTSLNLNYWGKEAPRLINENLSSLVNLTSLTIEPTYRSGINNNNGFTGESFQYLTRLVKLDVQNMGLDLRLHHLPVSLERLAIDKAVLLEDITTVLPLLKKLWVFDDNVYLKGRSTMMLLPALKRFGCFVLNDSGISDWKEYTVTCVNSKPVFNLDDCQ